MQGVRRAGSELPGSHEISRVGHETACSVSTRYNYTTKTVLCFRSFTVIDTCIHICVTA